MNKLLRLNAEFLAVLAGSIVAGFTIGVLQHYVSFGAWGYGFSRESFELALLEGGIVGGMFAIPTGLITYYVILKRDLTVLRLAVVVLGSLVLGITTGMAIFWLSAFVTPVLTLALAFFARFAPSQHHLCTSHK